MPAIYDSLGALGRVHKGQFNLLATGEADNLSVARDLQQFAGRAYMLRDELTRAFGLTPTTLENDLAAIVTHAEAGGFDAASVKEALAQFRAMSDMLPSDPSNRDTRIVARKVLGYAPD
jgi:hypothetical protein